MWLFYYNNRWEIYLNVLLMANLIHCTNLIFTHISPSGIFQFLKFAVLYSIFIDKIFNKIKNLIIKSYS